MLTIEPTRTVLGAVARVIDLAQPLGGRSGLHPAGFGRHGVLRQVTATKVFGREFPRPVHEPATEEAG